MTTNRQLLNIWQQHIQVEFEEFSPTNDWGLQDNNQNSLFDILAEIPLESKKTVSSVFTWLFCMWTFFGFGFLGTTKLHSAALWKAHIENTLSRHQ
jgi:hypothetical protein